MGIIAFPKEKQGFPLQNQRNLRKTKVFGPRSRKNKGKTRFLTPEPCRLERPKSIRRQDSEVESIVFPLFLLVRGQKTLVSLRFR